MSGCRVRKDHWKGMSAMERSAIAQQQVQQVAEKKARQQLLLHEDWQYARSQADIARNMASQANQVSVQSLMLPLTTGLLYCAWEHFLQCAFNCPLYAHTVGGLACIAIASVHCVSPAQSL